MRTYWGLPTSVRESFEALERELGRPIALHPGVPTNVSRYWSDHLGDTRAALDLPHLTAEQAAELCVFVSFQEPDRPRTVTVHFDGYGPVSWSRGDDQPLAFRDLDGDPDEPDLGCVEPRRVLVWLTGLPYLPADNDRVLRLWDVILEQVRRSVSDDVAAEHAERRRQVIRERVASMVSGRHERSIRERRSNIERDERRLLEYEHETRAALESLRRGRLELDLLHRLAEEDSGESLLAEYDLLVAHPRVTEVDLENDTSLVLTTDPVVMTHPSSDETRWLGRFKVTLDLAEGFVKLNNLDNPRNGRDHPHVPHGDPCFGGHADEFQQLIVNGRWATFLELLFQFLETFNPSDDWGRWAALWFDEPDVDPENPTARPAAGRGVEVHVTEDGTRIHAGDRVEFVRPGTTRTYSGVATAPVDDYTWGVLVDDDALRGGGPNGEWLISTEEVRLIEPSWLVLHVTADGDEIRAGDRIEYTDEDGDETYGVAVGPHVDHAGEDTWLATNEVNPDGGAGPNGEYVMSACEDIVLVSRARTA